MSDVSLSHPHACGCLGATHSAGRWPGKLHGQAVTSCASHGTPTMWTCCAGTPYAALHGIRCPDLAAPCRLPCVVHAQGTKINSKGKEVAHGVRLYSIASSRYGDYYNGQTATLCVRRAVYNDPETGAEDPAKKGLCSNFLCDAKPGQEIMMTGGLEEAAAAGGGVMRARGACREGRVTRCRAGTRMRAAMQCGHRQARSIRPSMDAIALYVCMYVYVHRTERCRVLCRSLQAPPARCCCCPPTPACR